MTITTLDSASLVLTRVPINQPSFITRVRDWADREAVHRAVMTLFAPKLPGDEAARRAMSAILYRVEDDQRNPHLLIQSRVAPASNSVSLASTDLTGLAPRLISGTAVRFRLDVNAVRCQSRSRRRLPVPESEIPGWLTNTVMNRGLDAIEAGELKVNVLRTRTTPLRVARIDGTATVRDEVALLTLLAEGVGRAKAYGCGLLSVLPVG
ncbi:MAG: type I-E CRISPR-associated protein Cas6/Cse3/CasE [Acidimicrobiales bacterium]